jgi:hypothetical protein
MRIGAGTIAWSALALLCAACGEQEPSRDNAVRPTPAPAVTATEPAVTATVAPAAKPLLNLASDGLSLVDPDSGSARHVEFGTAQYQTTQMINSALGNFTGQAENPECGAGPLTSFDYPGGLTLFFQEGKFAGWDLDGQGGYSTADGIAIGMTRAALDESGSEVSVEESTIGHEFAAGDLYGLLTGSGASAKVTNLWAGTTCIFR